MKISKYYKLIIFTFIIVIVLIDILSQNITDWSPSFSKDDEIPFGMKVFDLILPEIFPESKISYNTKSLYESLDTNSTNQMLIINNDNYYKNKKNSIDSKSFEKLLKWIENGNTAFLNLSYINLDTLKIRTMYNFSSYIKDSISVEFSFVNMNTEIKYANFKKGNYSRYIGKYDTAKIEPLVYSEGRKCMIKQKWGKGEIYLATMPYLFTNYNLLYDNKQIALNFLSYLPKADEIILDDYYINTYKAESTHPLRYIMSQKSLKWAYYTILLTVIIAAIFSIKRKQKAIPILPSKKNTSLAFINSISGLFMEENDNRFIAQKKFKHYKEFLKRKYNIKFDKIDNELISKITAKSGVSSELTTTIFENYKYAESGSAISLTLLEEFTENIDEFYKKVRNG